MSSLRSTTAFDDQFAPDPNSNEPIAWKICYTENGQYRTALCEHNSVGDYRDIDPMATSIPLCAAPVSAEPVAEICTKRLMQAIRYYGIQNKADGVGIPFYLVKIKQALEEVEKEIQALLSAANSAPVAAQPDVTQQTLDDVMAGIPARDAEIAALRKEIETLQAAQAQQYVSGGNLADRLDVLADTASPGSQMQSDLYAAATIWRKHLKGPAAQQPVSGADELPRLGDALSAIEWLERRVPQSYKGPNGNVACVADVKEHLSRLVAKGEAQLYANPVQPAQQDADALTVDDYKKVLADSDRLTAELGRLLMGDDAPTQPRLCDLVSFAQNEGIVLAGQQDASLIRMLCETLDLARTCHGAILMSDPPKEMWKVRGVDQAISKALHAAGYSRMVGETHAAAQQKADAEKYWGGNQHRMRYLTDHTGLIEITARDEATCNAALDAVKDALAPVPTRQDADKVDAEPDMFWDDNDPDRCQDSIHDVLDMVQCNRGLSVGDVVDVQRAIRLPNVSVRITAIEHEDGSGEWEYEAIDAARKEQA